MIIVNYVYEFLTILSYKRIGDEGREIVLPRQDEFVDISGTMYRVVAVTHVLSRDAYDSSKQHINIKLTRQLVKE